MRLVLACVLLAVAAAPAGAQTRVARDRGFTRSVEAGQEVRVFNFTRFHRDCRADDPPVIRVTKPPAHGSVAVRSEPSTVSVLREDAADCTGHTYPGSVVIYVPAPGFRGVDQFAWDVIEPIQHTIQQRSPSAKRR